MRLHGGPPFQAKWRLGPALNLSANGHARAAPNLSAGANGAENLAFPALGGAAPNLSMNGPSVRTPTCPRKGPRVRPMHCPCEGTRVRPMKCPWEGPRVRTMNCPCRSRPSSSARICLPACARPSLAPAATFRRGAASRSSARRAGAPRSPRRLRPCSPTSSAGSRRTRRPRRCTGSSRRSLDGPRSSVEAASPVHARVSSSSLARGVWRDRAMRMGLAADLLRWAHPRPSQTRRIPSVLIGVLSAFGAATHRSPPRGHRHGRRAVARWIRAVLIGFFSDGRVRSCSRLWPSRAMVIGVASKARRR